MAMPSVQLYAELLANIRQVSVLASFGGPVDATRTTAVVLSDGQTLRIHHNGQTAATMTLPGRVAVAGHDKSLPIAGAALASGDVTWRLPVATINDAGEKFADDSLAPWSAPDLPANAKIACRACDTEIVAAGKIHSWKDLPSDNWAEMMEFWHCHKPDTKKSDTGEVDKINAQDRLADRGYGANSGFSAAENVGLVDLTTLLLLADDCQQLLFSSSSVDMASSDRETILSSAPANVRGLHAYCPSCRVQLGYLTLRRQQSVHLFKWQVSVTGTCSSPPSMAECVGATLISTVQRTGSSKSLVLPIHELDCVSGRVDASGKEEKVLQVWVLNSTIKFAAWPTVMAAGAAIKLLYRFVPRKDAEKMLDSLNSDVQEISLPRETIVAMTDLLEISNGLLPPSVRLFQEWKVGLLPRWKR
ncbi:hypothetical protein SEPCBS119000_005607 [Sporothrix epigloea]|uniref:Ubiquitin-conjugating enzyme E2C-binding protein n=1 Tax=Sporothrix epigloea TaxID=1892477 RepID=A0ABP0DYH3_9PEZI